MFQEEKMSFHEWILEIPLPARKFFFARRGEVRLEDEQQHYCTALWVGVHNCFVQFYVQNIFTTEQGTVVSLLLWQRGNGFVFVFGIWGHFFSWLYMSASSQSLRIRKTKRWDNDDVDIKCHSTCVHIHIVYTVVGGEMLAFNSKQFTFKHF